MNYTPKVLQDLFLQSNKSELCYLRDEILVIFDKYSDIQKKWKPDLKRWCIDEIVTHLSRSLKLYLEKLEPAKVKTKEKGLVQISSYKPSLFAKVFLAFLNPESSFRIPTFPAFKPTSAQVNGNTERKFTEVISGYINYINDIDGYDLKKIKISSPVSPLLRFSIGEAIEINIIHIQRHLGQINQLINHPDFPEN